MHYYAYMVIRLQVDILTFHPLESHFPCKSYKYRIIVLLRATERGWLRIWLDEKEKEIDMRSILSD